MKNIIKIVILFVFNFLIAQVGIGTDTPTATLDVNGTARIRTLNDGSNSATYPYFIVADPLGNLAKADRPSKLYHLDLKYTGLKKEVLDTFFFILKRTRTDG
ncbi:hypothetical protein BWK59_05355 [Flavobacterium davisii]|uniref:Uncharacterized protein n=1 Tax=Flavobacterium davisii TaxID=2906077 RepID=A0A2D0AIN6_9FLAO|nr:hypothetical protein [Flavobacterium davisii]OWP84416.1 hypothetical protein BWK59_05355 [Flavobacterium davisii]